MFVCLCRSHSPPTSDGSPVPHSFLPALCYHPLITILTTSSFRLPSFFIYVMNSNLQSTHCSRCGSLTLIKIAKAGNFPGHSYYHVCISMNAFCIYCSVFSVFVRKPLHICKTCDNSTTVANTDAIPCSHCCATIAQPHPSTTCNINGSLQMRKSMCACTTPCLLKPDVQAVLCYP